ncbi:PREDICTED: putative receptor-like protein kinase At1g80870 isoform X1 [Ipomoea nil]|uniref:putative receptor-like protein kinase At1g80870 isoform X1 n=1 Tax=Ipomoea nil TaxID=35883 RepID=UPI000900E67F|nr:PREDICTED: putative receptor-like protein kinase At1g80870 isoform X1 [Ipomoea nil]
MPSRQALSSDSEPKITDIFIAITTLAALIILFAILYFLYYLWYSLVHRARTSPFDSNAPLVKLQRFSYRELKWATQGFSESSSIGKGGSGSVFRGKLKNGKWVAVKLLDCASFQTEREFQNELQILGGIKSPLVVSLLGYSVEKSKRLVVYEYMPNRSLQESLFSETNLGLNWSRRFDIILDVAKALAFLHLECNPPVVHGDVKPSNVLLDSELRAKLSDFGLSRLKVEGEFGVDLFSQDLGKSQDLSGNLGVGTGGTQTPGESHDEVDFALALQASSSSKNTAKMVQNVRALGLMNSMNYNAVFESDEKSRNLKGKEVENSEFGNYDDELSSSIDHSKELGGGDDNVVSKTQWGRDWWWRQDGSGELCSKDYVMEWIGSQICPSANPDWDEHNNKSPNRKPSLENSTRFTKFEEAKEPELGSLKKGFELESQTKKPRKMKEWWKEEHLDELSEKKKKNTTKEKRLSRRLSVPHFDLGKRLVFFRRSRPKIQAQNASNLEREFSFRRGWKKKKTNSHSIGSDIWSGDLFSRELSSTTSMRGTLCYVAPEFGGCGYLMEKADIYSLGVLILVIVSGRRPLHVLNSPMKLEKANLISWCKQLAHSGNILELVDERLRDEYNKDQASLCINLALACLQRMPELRPDIGDIVKILRGEMELPPLPFEFSPSPPSKMFNRSRRRQKSNAESASK